jgi:PAS domain S-box-containing protein
MDITPMAFILISAAVLVSFFRYRLLDVLLIARTEVFAGLHDPVLVLDDSNHLLDLNPAAERILDVRGVKSFGHKIDRLLEHHPEVLGTIRKNIGNEIPVDVAGRRLYFAARFSPFTDHRGRNIGRIIIFQDITERKQMGDAMYETERLAGILEMVGAVCHDLSQPAMAASGYAELLLAGIAEDDPLHAPLTTLIAQVDKLGSINKKLLKITQSNPSKPE